jgi:hypothetical protein
MNSGSPARENNAIRRSPSLRERNIRNLTARNNGTRSNNYLRRVGTTNLGGPTFNFSTFVGNSTRRSNNRAAPAPGAAAGVGARPPRPSRISFNTTVRRRNINNSGSVRNTVVGLTNNTRNTRVGPPNRPLTANNIRGIRPDELKGLAPFIVFQLADVGERLAANMGGTIAVNGVHLLNLGHSKIRGSIEIVDSEGEIITVKEIVIPTRATIDKFIATKNNNNNGY